MFDFLLNVFETIIGGLLLTLALFLLNEFVFNKRNLSGEWIATVLINNTSYARFENLSITFKIHLLQQGYQLLGSGEKVSEMDSNGITREYLRQDRGTINIQGFFEKKYLAKSTVFLYINERGKIRETRATYTLEFISSTKLSGVFISTAGDSSGTVRMEKCKI